MAFLSSLDISAAGMSAQRLRLDIIAQNVANAQTTRTADGTPYRRQMVVFKEAIGNSDTNSVVGDLSFKNVLRERNKDEEYKGVDVVEVVEDQTPLTPVYDPTHPDADEMGYYYKPNVDLAVENIDSLEASRSWEANKAVFDVVKAMASNALTIGKA